jgi:hypothetical protein
MTQHTAEWGEKPGTIRQSLLAIHVRLLGLRFA